MPDPSLPDVDRTERIGTSALKPFVAVPARDEAERLPGLLAGLGAQDWIARSGRRLDVTIVLNNCRDDSRAVVERSAAGYPGLEIHLVEVEFDRSRAHVGNARRLAMDTACARSGDEADAAILTTDADAVPAADWVGANLRHLQDGIDLVGGLIVGDPSEEARLGGAFNRLAGLHQRYDRAADRLASLVDPVGHDPWPRHTDHTGASLALRSSVYRAVGGLPPLGVREDIALVEAVRAGGFRIRHPLDVVVQVSARLVGRAPGGMSDCLKTWLRQASSGEAVHVEHPHALLARLERRSASALPGADPRRDPIDIEAAILLLDAMVTDREAIRAA